MEIIKTEQSDTQRYFCEIVKEYQQKIESQKDTQSQTEKADNGNTYAHPKELNLTSNNNQNE